jgi:HD superfamily phosphohydrolase YqeK
MEFRIKKSWKDISYREILLCPYEDKMLALWVKLAFWLVWLINIPAGIIYGASFQYIAYVLSIVFAIGINIAISAKNYNIWIDFITLALVSIPVYGIFFSAYIKAFSVMYPVFFSCSVVFILGIKYSFFINFVCTSSIIYCCRINKNHMMIDMYGENVVLRLPYLFICMLLIIYCLMFIIQKNWIEKNRRKQVLESRISEENTRLENMSMKVMNTMVRALGAKIQGEEEHLRQVAEYAKQIAHYKGLEEKMCSNAYSAGLLHEIGMVGIPDALIEKEKLTEEEYAVFKTYVDKSYAIIIMLRSSSAESIAEAVHYHRESYDGNGYPDKLKGEDIPLLARILAVADYADRHLRRGEVRESVIEKINALSGVRFEPKDAQIMIDILME